MGYNIQFYPYGSPDSFSSILFKVYDANMDGFVDFKEFLMINSVTSKGSLENKVRTEVGLLYIIKDIFTLRAWGYVF